MTHGHFESTFSKYAFGRGEGVTKKSTLCTLVKMMTIMDDPLTISSTMAFNVAKIASSARIVTKSLTISLRVAGPFPLHRCRRRLSLEAVVDLYYINLL